MAPIWACASRANILGWYMDEAGTPAPLRRAVLTSRDTDEVLRLLGDALERCGRGGGMTSDQSIWNSLPVPAFIIDAEDRIADVNSSGEGFLNASRKAVIGEPVWDQIAVDAPLEEAFLRARQHGTPLVRQ